MRVALLIGFTALTEQGSQRFWAHDGDFSPRVVEVLRVIEAAVADTEIANRLEVSF